eukprot:19691_1
MKTHYWTERLTQQKLWALFFIQLNEGYQINCIYPFVVFMIRDFGFGEDDVGLYAGLLTATFSLTQFLSSYPWGYISDFYGRQRALLIGLIFSGVAIIIFGASINYYQAIIARSIAGIFNGNIGVAKAYVADITNSQNRPFAFSIFAIAFSFGIVLGSLAGGSLVYTWELDKNGMHRPSEGVLQWWVFYKQLPYLLPCLLGAVVSMISFVLTLIYIKDVNVDPEPTKHVSSDIQSLNGISDTRSLPMVMLKRDHTLVEWRYSSMDCTRNKNIRFTKASHDRALSLIGDSAMPTNSLYNCIVACKNVDPEKGKLLEKNAKNNGIIQIDSIADLFRKTKLVHPLVINSLIMLMLVAWNSIVPYFMAQTLQMNAIDIGIYMAWTGIMLFVSTWYVQPIVFDNFNHRKVYIAFGIAMLIVILLFPSIALIPHVLSWNKYVLLSVVALVGGFKHAFATMLYLAAICFLNNSVPNHACGRANGLGQAVASGLRGLGPLFGGILWSWSMTLNTKWAVYVAYIYMFIPSAYSVIHCVLYIDKDCQKTWEERYNMKQLRK